MVLASKELFQTCLLFCKANAAFPGHLILAFRIDLCELPVELHGALTKATIRQFVKFVIPLGFRVDTVDLDIFLFSLLKVGSVLLS